MTREHVTMWLMTCLMLIGVSHASFVRGSGSDMYEVVRSVERKEGPPPRAAYNLTSGGPKPPPSYIIPQCDKLACPPFEVMADKGSYRKVHFPEAVYAKVRVEGKTMMPALFSTYETLRHYYRGANDKKAKLPMTAPVILRLDPGQPDGMFNPRNFTLFFYMDPDVRSPPTPDDGDIDVLLVNSYSLYIRTFSSYTVTYGDWMRELLQLASDVEADGGKYKKDYFYFATYNSPFDVTNRLNEVQLLVI